MNLNALCRAILVICTFTSGAYSYAQPLQFEPLVDDWMISEELHLSESIERAPGGKSLYSPTVATNGKRSLVVWDAYDKDLNSRAIFGAFIDRAGYLLSNGRFEIPAWTAPKDNNMQVSVVHTAGQWLIVWLETTFRSGEQKSRVLGARISNTGVVLDPEGFEIRGIGGFMGGNWYAIASNNVESLAVWVENVSRTHPPRFRFNGSLIDKDGNVRDLASLQTIEPAGNHIQLTATQDGGFKAMASVSDREESVLVTLSDSGEILEVNRYLPDLNASGAQVECAGEDCLLFWTDTSKDDRNIVIGRFSTSLPTSFDASTPVSKFPESQIAWDITKDQIGFFVVWADHVPIPNRDEFRWELFGSRISRNGQNLDPNGLLLVSGPLNPASRWGGAIASNSMGMLLVYQDDNATTTIFSDYSVKAKLIIDADRFLILSEPSLTEEGRLQFQFNAAPGFDFTIEHTSDFETWSELTRFDDFSGEAIVTDETVENSSKFYRARRVE